MILIDKKRDLKTLFRDFDLMIKRKGELLIISNIALVLIILIVGRKWWGCGNIQIYELHFIKYANKIYLKILYSPSAKLEEKI